MPNKDKKLAYEWQRKWCAAHPEKVKEKDKKYVQTHYDKVLKYQREWHKSNPEKAREAARKYRATHPERLKKSRNKWDRANPEKRRAVRNLYKHRKLSVPGKGITPEEESQMFEEYNYRCAYCLGKKTLRIDHVIPISRNGINDITNMVPACDSCNSSKGNKPLLIWLLLRLNRC